MNFEIKWQDVIDSFSDHVIAKLDIPDYQNDEEYKVYTLTCRKIRQSIKEQFSYFVAGIISEAQEDVESEWVYER